MPTPGERVGAVGADRQLADEQCSNSSRNCDKFAESGRLATIERHPGAVPDANLEFETFRELPSLLEGRDEVWGSAPNYFERGGEVRDRRKASEHRGDVLGQCPFRGLGLRSEFVDGDIEMRGHPDELEVPGWRSAFPGDEPVWLYADLSGQPPLAHGWRSLESRTNRSLDWRLGHLSTGTNAVGRGLGRPHMSLD